MLARLAPRAIIRRWTDQFRQGQHPHVAAIPAAPGSDPIGDSGEVATVIRRPPNVKIGGCRWRSSALFLCL